MTAWASARAWIRLDGVVLSLSVRAKIVLRITAIVSNLQSLGIDAEQSGDGFLIHGNRRPLSGLVRSYGDHRIAMAFALLEVVAVDSALDAWGRRRRSSLWLARSLPPSVSGFAFTATSTLTRPSSVGAPMARISRPLAIPSR